MTATELGSGQYMVADPLPGGFEIENPDLASGAGVGALAWLTVDTPSHVEARTDQFVAAFRYETDTPTLSTAYMVRAVSPGSFVLPAPPSRICTGPISVQRGSGERRGPRAGK